MGKVILQLIDLIDDQNVQKLSFFFRKRISLCSFAQDRTNNLSNAHVTRDSISAAPATLGINVQYAIIIKITMRFKRVSKFEASERRTP